MDIPLDDLMRFLTPLLPYLLRAGERAAEEAGRRIAGDTWDGIRALWSRLRARASVARAARDLESAPDDPDALAAFRYQLRRALTEDPALAEELISLWRAREVHVYVHHLPPPALERPRPYHNLPQPDYVRFIGRERELAWLRSRLSPADRTWILLLTGIGGVGKTALALRIAHEYLEKYSTLSPEERFDAIVWASAKEQVLTPTGVEPGAPPGLVSHTLAEVYRAIAQALDRDAITRALPEAQDREVQKALTAQRTLLVIDNIDTMDDAVRAFLRNLPPPTKAIVTSREWLNVADVLTVRGMAREDALALIEAEAEPRGLGLSREQKERLYERTAGLPLPIRLSVARLGSGETFEQVLRWLGDATGDLPRYCIGGQVELARKRNPNAYRLLLACSLFDRDAGASREALGEITDLSIADRDEGLTLLERLNLVNRVTDDRFWMLPMVQEYARARLEEEEFGPVLVERWLGWALAFAQEWAANLDIRIRHLPIVAAEYPNLRRVLAWCEEHQHWGTFISLVENLWFYPYLTGLLNEARRILGVARDAAQLMGNESAVGQFLRRRGILLWEQGEKTKGVETLNEAVAITRRRQNLKELGLALERLSDYLTELGNPEEGWHLASEALAVGEMTADLQIKAIAAYRLSMAESARGNLEASQKWLDQGETWAKELGWERAMAWFAYRRGANLVEASKYAEAELWLLKAIEMMTWEEPRLIAYAKARLAQVYLGLGRREEARRMAQEALNLIDRMGLYILREEVERMLSGEEPEGVR